MKKVRELLASWKAGRPNAIMRFDYAWQALERAVNEDESSKPAQIVRYAQVEAIHEAMRECEELGPATYNDRDGYECATFDDVDVRKCFARIRDALAGAAKCTHCPSPADGPHKMSCAKRFGQDRAALAGLPKSDERMVRPEDVAPAVTERSTEDSKITWQG